jgi:hypothetical protein
MPVTKRFAEPFVRREGRKRFFFEKKKQKTFDLEGGGGPPPWPHGTD